KVFEAIDLKFLELKKIYRQKDENFIHLLNALRHNQLQDHHLHAFNSRHQNHIEAQPREFYITLTSTNATAEAVNQKHLKGLPGKEYGYEGLISGEFERRNLPTTERLNLK